MKTPSFCFRSATIFVFLFISVSYLYANAHAERGDASIPAPIIEVTGVDFDFGYVFSGTQLTQPHQFIIRNVGQQTLTFQVTVTNPDFIYDSDFISTLLPGESVVKYLIFKPSSVGVISGTLTITSNDPVNPDLNFNMTGVGLTSPVQETFIQDTVIESGTTTRLLQITNTSNERSEFHLEPFQNNFIQFPVDTYFLDPGESVMAELRFTGFGHVGYDHGVFLLSHLSINGNAIDPIFISVELLIQEEAWGPVASVSGGSNADFGSLFVGCDMIGTVILEINNPSPTPLICQLSSSDPNFRIYGPDSTFIITQDDFFSAGYTFIPLEVGDFSGVITLTTNDPDHPIFTWNVHGTGVEAPIQTVQDTVIAGEQSTKVVTIRNTTPEPISFFLASRHNDEHNSFLELSIAPDTISLPSGGVETFEVFFDATDFTPGVYYGAIEVVCHCNYGDIDVPFVVTVVDSIQAIQLPDSIHVEVPIGAVQSSSFVIQNTGNANLNYSIEAGSIESGIGSRLYSTGFEEFALGSLLFKGGWYSADYIYFQDNSFCSVAVDNPFSGSHHLRGVSNNGSPAGLYTQQLAIGPNGIFGIDMMVDFEPGVIWMISVWDHNVNIKEDGSMMIDGYYVDGHSGSTFVPGLLPSGYFNLKFTINNDTQEISIAVDGNTVFSGFSFSRDQSQIAFNFASEGNGQTLDIDNIRFTKGDESIELLTIDYPSGTIPPLSSQTINLVVDTRNIDAGVYEETVIIHNNDLLTDVSIPFTATVIGNSSPELLNVSDTSMVAGETLSLTFNATDVDDDVVSVESFYMFSSDNYYNYDLETASGNGYVTYDFITPESPIDSDFTGMVLARDSRGGVVSKYFSIHVLGHNTNDFALTNFNTNVDLYVFTDTVVLDMARPDIDKLTIQFKPVSSYKHSPEEPMEIYIGSPDDVRFVLDGNAINIDQSSPYYINAWEIPKLSQGYHTLTAIANYDSEFLNGQSTRRIIIHVINSTSISGFDVVDSNGSKLMDLIEGSIIDLSQPGFNSFNIIANPSISSMRSVKFTLNNVTARIDNSAPYALGGNPILGDTYWKTKVGNYTLTATPYMKYFAWGPNGTPLTIHFQVVNGVGTGSTLAKARERNSSQEKKEELATEATEIVWSVYPVPANDDLHIRLEGNLDGNISLKLISLQGQLMHATQGTSEAFRDYVISTEELGLNPGLYLVQIQQANGRRFIKKIAKQ